MDEATVRAALMRHWAYEGVDFDISHEIYHDDAVLEFPQSGERFVGRSNVQTWRQRYPAKVKFRIRRISGRANLWVTEYLISYDDGPWMFVVNILTFRGDRVAHEAIYIMEGFDAAEWRTPWSTPFDPFESVAPEEWREGEPFGIGR